ncbi:hypothetical protein D9757_011001 [Collybiopsis confluens]|uniref:Uncharacterized protein n=1 Tax=Collybiopsis confluens TaxID=2823264 RepID=A0A8H5GD50_9AGAR|nr:hypothetical protein D9757_011001 [Collybiopsis confluens]
MASSSQKAFFLERKGGVFYEAFALNSADWKVQAVDFLLIKAYPTVIGADAAEDVEQVGEDYGNDNCAVFQQYALAPAQFAIKVQVSSTYEGFKPHSNYAASSALVIGSAASATNSTTKYLANRGAPEPCCTPVLLP